MPHLTPANEPMVRLITGLQNRYGALPGSLDDGHVAALKQLWRLTYREASTLAFADAFGAIMVAFVVATALVPLLRKGGSAQGATGRRALIRRIRRAAFGGLW